MTPHVYPFYVEEVISGSSLIGWIDLGFDLRIRRKIQLINIKCFDPAVPQGAAAQRFVQCQLANRHAFVRTFKDKYRKYNTVLTVLYTENDDGTVTSINDLLVEQAMGHFMGVMNEHSPQSATITNRTLHLASSQAS